MSGNRPLHSASTPGHAAHSRHRRPRHAGGGSPARERPPTAGTTPPEDALNAEPPRAPAGTASAATSAAGDVVRWCTFSCALVPVVLLVCGSSVLGALLVAGGLALVTAVCRALLLQSLGIPPSETLPEPRPRPRDPLVEAVDAWEALEAARKRRREVGNGTGAHRGGRHGKGRTPPR